MFWGTLGSSVLAVCEVSYPALEVTDGVASPILINLSDFLCPILTRKSKKITCIL